MRTEYVDGRPAQEQVRCPDARQQEGEVTRDTERDSVLTLVVPALVEGTKHDASALWSSALSCASTRG